MRKAASGRAIPLVEVLEGRELLSVSPSLAGQQVFPTHTVMEVNAGTLGQPITFDVKVFARVGPGLLVDLYTRGKRFQELGLLGTHASDPRFYGLLGSEATYTIPAGAAGAEMFGVGLHFVRAQFIGTEGAFYPSAAVVAFRVARPQFVTQPSGVGTATLVAGSGPALQPGQSATLRYNAYLAASYRLFYSTESKSPDIQSFVLDANPEQVIPGLDAGVIGMQAGETRAIYIPRSLSRGVRGSLPAIQPRANLVYLVTLVSIT